MKFKVGDKVKIKENLIVNKAYGAEVFTTAMINRRGCTAIIEKVNNKYQVYSLVFNWDKDEYFWTDEMLEACNEINDEAAFKQIRKEIVFAVFHDYEDLLKSKYSAFDHIDAYTALMELKEVCEKYTEVNE